MKRKHYIILMGVLLAVAFEALIQWEVIVFPEPWIKRLVSFAGLLTIIFVMRYFGKKNNNKE